MELVLKSVLQFDVVLKTTVDEVCQVVVVFVEVSHTVVQLEVAVVDVVTAEVVFVEVAQEVAVAAVVAMFVLTWIAVLNLCTF